MALAVGRDAGQPDVSAVARYLQDVPGQNLTAVIADVRDVQKVAKRASGAEAPQPQAKKRLRDAYQITQVLMQVELPETVRDWFLGMTPAFEDRVPAVILRQDPDAVLRAARFFVANGRARSTRRPRRPGFSTESAAAPLHWPGCPGKPSARDASTTQAGGSACSTKPSSGSPAS